MAHSRKVKFTVPTFLFTDGTFYYGVASNMILRTKFISYAIFHTTEEVNVVTALLSKYGIDHSVHPSSGYRNINASRSTTGVEVKPYNPRKVFSVHISQHEFNVLSACRPKALTSFVHH